MGKTTIEWTDFSINPFRARNKETGQCGHFCVKLSGGCKLCYSSRMQKRFGLFPFLAENRSKVELILDESKLQDVLRRRIPTKYFWCDMTDMFLEDYPDEWIDRCFGTMFLTPWHTHMVLTKRAQRLKYFSWRQAECGILKIDTPYPDIRIPESWPLPNCWLGVSAEDQKTWDERTAILEQVPATVRFVSLEPQLEYVDVGPVLARGKIHWLVQGGESGPGARAFNVDWARDARKKSEGYAAYFLKQVGANPFEIVPCRDYDWQPKDITLRDHKGGDMSEWEPGLRVRQFPEVRK